jgi:hypothetical protein
MGFPCTVNGTHKTTGSNKTQGIFPNFLHSSCTLNEPIMYVIGLCAPCGPDHLSNYRAAESLVPTAISAIKAAFFS